jgi:two-component system cell cycle sensor histidine kinase/response regulator CckA
LRSWSERERWLLREIGNRLEDALELQNTFERLRESEERFRSIFHAVKEGIFLADPSSLSIITANQTLLLQLQCDDDHLATLSMLDVLGEHPTASLLASLSAGEAAELHEVSIPRRDGGDYFADVALRQVEIGRSELLLGCIRDVTQLREIRAGLAQSDRMASVGVLAAGVAHEINNPLTYILYNLEGLVMDLPRFAASAQELMQELSEEQRRKWSGTRRSPFHPGFLETLVASVKDAHEGAERVREIVKDLRTFSRMDSDRCISVDLNDVIDGALNMAQNEVKYRAKLVKEYSQLPVILGNDGKLAQVFLNLIVNAVHSIDEGAVDDNEIRLRTWQQGDEICASVGDTGCGIAKENLARLFEPFFTTKEVGIGSGLGLSICRNIIAAMGGTIEVESTMGEGSVFTVRVPIRQPAETDEQPVVGQPLVDPARRGRILVVDDETSIGRAVSCTLSNEHVVVAVSSGRKAAEILKEDSAFDVVVSDLLMPDFTGMDLYEWVRSELPDLARKMVFITGGAFTPRAASFLDKVENPRLEKPFDMKDLRKHLRALLD